MRVVQVKEGGNLTASYAYDENGNKISETLANGVVSTYSYNACNKVTKLVTKSGKFDISSYEYSYYLDGSDACKVRNENGIIETTSYDYDGLKRLTKESISNGKTADTYSYEYDDYGNRSKMVANGSEEYETVYDYTVNGKYTALLQKEIKTVKETPSAVTSNNGLAISPTDLITSTAADAKREETAYSYDANGNQITKITADDFKYAKVLNRSIKLLASSRKVGNSYSCMVAPFMLSAEHPLCGVNGVFNGIFVHGNVLGDAMFYGSGAGKLPTASAVVADIVDMTKHKNTNIYIDWSPEKLTLVDYKDSVNSFFVRTSSGKETIENAFGSVVYADAGIAGEIGFTTKDMTEAEFEKAAAQIEVRNRIRLG